MQKVRVYWNLHKKVWSIQDCKSGLVCDHLDRITLEQAKFVVRKGGQKRVRQEGKKNVHAFAEGWVSRDQDEDHTHYWYDISYNPYKNDYFMIKDQDGNVEEVPRDWVGNIHMDCIYNENSATPKVYV